VLSQSIASVEHLQIQAVEFLQPVQLNHPAQRARVTEGIFAGSRQMFEDLNGAVTEARLKPVIDRTFAFGQVREALECLRSGAHFGKIVIRIAD
jgi:NADPH:quinone reductase-like Zn-dependent oxidoreductase